VDPGVLERGSPFVERPFYSPNAAGTGESRPGRDRTHDVGVNPRPHRDPGRVPIRWRAALRLLRHLPQGLLSRMAGRVADLPLPTFLRGPVNGAFARLVGVNLSESAGAPGDYRTLSAFFVRELRPGLRSWPRDEGVPGSPVDGQVGVCGRLDEGMALQAKGTAYSVADLLGSESDGSRFRSGVFITLYLSPRHYHRIHAPLRGRIRKARALPGRLLPVNLPSVRYIPDLFPRNERLVAFLESRDLSMALVAVGAYNVGRISAGFDPPWNGPRGRGVTNRAKRSRSDERSYDPPLEVGAGDEIMRFHLGSTVVLLMTPAGEGGISLHPRLSEGQEILLGSPLLDGP
jgi:phosphatidylserine decarboxylase